MVLHPWQGLLGALMAEVHKVSGRYRAPLAEYMQELSLKPPTPWGCIMKTGGGPHAGAPVPAQEDGLALRHRAQLRALSENSCSSQLGSDLHSQGYALSDSLSLPAILATGEDPSWLDAWFFCTC